ncbi:MAG TPA: lasso RiPP family leader peptide-containing protein [Anaerolineaceae bacterium]|nr:lasso RiPP family leader peptide-containing protein [Anaerolineaceae bacterium]HPN53471.1 lasso RiPP family leader peptide-containing protein [Anaerolineaceae bacterium]
MEFYETPELIEFGDVNDLTLLFFTGGDDGDGGTQPT